MTRLPLVLALAAALGCGSFASTRPPASRPRPAIDDVAAASPNRGMKAYWIGHATVLVQMADRWIITDPNFSPRVGVFVKRRVAPGIDLDALPEIDWVLISHAHLDHLDHPSLRRLNESASLAAPPGVVHYLPGHTPFREVVALSPWQAVERDGVRITAIPVRHGDGRFGLDELYNRHAHTGYVVEHAGMTLFFAGDTAYDPVSFKQVGERFAVDLALIPVGPAGTAFGPMMRRVHVSPPEALRILADVRARWMIPIHHGTFFTGGARELDAIEKAIRQHPLHDRVLLLRAGESVTVEPPASRG
ncbi:MAG TPA: MBL fold metallo-hydrolase [Polyangia bacterium]|nr:MBL fold metallo-hydrolase [Polyangia bacterium]